MQVSLNISWLWETSHNNHVGVRIVCSCKTDTWRSDAKQWYVYYGVSGINVLGNVNNRKVMKQAIDITTYASVQWTLLANVIAL